MKHVLEDLFKTAQRLPNKIAFSDGNFDMTFAQLLSDTNAIASELNKRGIYRKPVAILMERHPRQVGAFFGVIRSGSYYIPLDSAMPKDRIEQILETSDAKTIIVDESQKAKAMEISKSLDILVYEELIKGDINEKVLNEIYDKSIDTDPIYIVFTSGSTGKPKGVVACHRSVLDYIYQLSNTLGFNENTVFGNQSPLYFDACLKEIYPTIRFGATTYFIPKILFMSPVKLVEFLNEHKINTICWVVSALTIISSLNTFDKIIPSHLTTIAFGSEVFAPKQFNMWRKALPNANFTNLYGPTEATGMSCYYHVKKDITENEVIPIGKPFDNTEIFLIDDNGKEADEGEIFIRGTAVTLGYYHDKERTAESFVQNPLHDDYPDIVYRTGDLARRNADNDLVFIGRKDYQVKHMGHRIELGEIEAFVNRMEGIRECAAIMETKKDKLVLFYSGDVEPKDILMFLKSKIPPYMIPNQSVKLDELLHLPNGKIDRNSLKEKL